MRKYCELCGIVKTRRWGNGIAVLIPEGLRSLPGLRVLAWRRVISAM